MTREQRLELLKQIEKDIYVPSIESTFLDDAKSCAIHSVIEELEQEPKTGWHIAHGMYEDRFWCSCGYIKIIDSNTSKWKYCPVCGGTKMVEPQERSDKE